MNYISFFKINIPSYSLTIITGLIIANLLAFKTVKKKALDFDNVILLETYCLAFGAIGAKLLYLFIIRNEIDWSKLFNWSYMKNFIQGGFVFYGGLAGFILGILIASKLHKIDVPCYVSELIFCLPLVHGFGRIGCYLSGCCYGIPYSGPYAVEYHNIPYALCDIKLFPVQLAEALLLFIFAGLFYYLTLNNKSNLNFITGYLASYGITRFILEFFRFDSQRGSLLMLSTSQWISILIVTACILVIWFNKKPTSKL